MKRIVCMVVGHQWQPDPKSRETYPVLLCEQCGKRRELSERLVREPGIRRTRR